MTDPSVRRKVVVVGAGITGLCAARALAQDFDVTVFESESSFGGKLQTMNLHGHAIDIGPDAFITRNPAATKLASDLGLSDRLVVPSAGSAAVYARGTLRPLPKGLAIGIPTNAHALSRSGIVSYRGSLRTLVDRVLPTRVVPHEFASLAASGIDDRTVAAIVGKRLGKETLAMLVDPLIGGINASDVDALSFAAAVPQFVDLIAGRRTLMGALRSAQSSHAASQAGNVSNSLSPIFQGIAGGMSQLVDALVAQCRSENVTFHNNTTVGSLSLNDAMRPDGHQQWSLQSDLGTFFADAVVLATPAYTTATLLEPVSRVLAEILRMIAFSSVATVTGVWRRDDVVGKLLPLRKATGAKPPVTDPTRLAGVLVPRAYRHLITAASFTSSKWPTSSSVDEFVIRCSSGRHGDDRASNLSDNELIEEVLRDVSVVLGLSAPPIDVHVARWNSAFPQYTTGHLARVASIEKIVQALPGLHVSGASYHGIGIPACIDSAHRAANECATYLRTL